MAVVNHRARVFYVVVPKVACTSVKTLFWQLDGGKVGAGGWMSRLLGRGRSAIPRTSVHQLEGYRTTEFSRIGPVPDGYARIALVRDPLARLHSAWTNKVCRRAFEQRGEGGAIVDNALELDPSFGFFVDNFDLYRMISRPARNHTEPFAWHLGEDLRWYDHVFRLEEISSFLDFISDRVGRKVELPSRNVSDGEARPLGLEPRHADRLRALLASDYALLAQHYRFDRSLEAFCRRHAVSF
jgi:hypothetical protein